MAQKSALQRAPGQLYLRRDGAKTVEDLVAAQRVQQRVQRPVRRRQRHARIVPARAARRQELAGHLERANPRRERVGGGDEHPAEEGDVLRVGEPHDRLYGSAQAREEGRGKMGADHMGRSL